MRVRVTKAFGESTVSKILDLVENASSKKARAENFITKFARVYTPCVVIAAVLLAVVPSLVSGDWSEWTRALIFLVVSCPCALVISVPLSFFGGIGGASRDGILVKGGSYLETLSQAEIVVFDKTGTLTKGVFNVTAIHPDKISEAELLELAAYAESYSDHPISRSIREAYGEDIDQNRVGAVEELAGRGVRAEIDGRNVCVGNSKLMDELGAKWHPCHHVGTTVHVEVDGLYAGHLVISDEVKPDAAEAIRKLKELGVKKTVMLTGDAQAVGERVGAELGLDEVHAQLLPAGKVERVEALLKEKSDKGALVFVGDGINDAPVLSRADVGVAMGGMGSDAAIEAADVVFMDDKPSKLADAIRIARKTRAIVRQNVVFALAVKLLVMVLGAFRRGQHVGGGVRRRGRFRDRHTERHAGAARAEIGAWTAKRGRKTCPAGCQSPRRGRERVTAAVYGGGRAVFSPENPIFQCENCFFAVSRARKSAGFLQKLVGAGKPAPQLVKKVFLTSWWTGEQAPPPLPPPPVSAEILRISGRGNCKEAIYCSVK